MASSSGARRAVLPLIFVATACGGTVGDNHSGAVDAGVADVNVTSCTGTAVGDGDAATGCAGTSCVVLGDGGVGESCTDTFCCGSGLACVHGRCASQCNEAYGHPCPTGVCCSLGTRDSNAFLFCNPRGYCQSE